jgi:hypothetical protein
MKRLNVLDMSQQIQMKETPANRKILPRQRPGSSYIKRSQVMSRMNRRCYKGDISTLENIDNSSPDTRMASVMTSS